jgi:hypothetical protein
VKAHARADSQAASDRGIGSSPKNSRDCHTPNGHNPTQLMGGKDSHKAKLPVRELMAFYQMDERQSSRTNFGFLMN